MTTPTLTTGLQQRDHLAAALQLRAEDETAGGWEVEGIGVPYGQEVELFPGLFEEFARDAVDTELSADALLYYGHREPIGRVAEQRNTEAGWEPRATISDTSAGRDAHTLARDGVLSKLSVGFEPIEFTERIEDDGSVHITHTRVRVREVSLVPMPAYVGAELTAVRHAHPDQPSTTPTTTPREDTAAMGDSTATTTDETLADLQTRMGELARRIELGLPEQRQTPLHPLLQFRSMGEFVKALVDSDETARTAYEQALQVREYAGGTTADVDVPQNSWVGDLIRIAQAKQPVTNSFLHTNDLPGTGMGVDYGVLGEDTTKVEQQTAEGADLPFGKVTIGHDTAGVGTYGGYTQLTRQEIERMSINMLDLAWQAMTATYGKRIELLGRGIFTAAHVNALASENNKVALRAAMGDANAVDWLALVLDLAETFDDRTRELTGVKVSRDAFLALASVESTDRMLVVRGAPAGTNAAGTLSVTVPEANLYGVNIELVPKWGGAKIAAYDRAAIRTQESPGAPFRLQDGNVINLTNAFSVYGYAASYQQMADGIVAVELPGAAG